ncbi:hypothetical protein SARC_17105, partial [Sphaeroforma arctica JP610]
YVTVEVKKQNTKTPMKTPLKTPANSHMHSTSKKRGGMAGVRGPAEFDKDTLHLYVISAHKLYIPVD